MLKDCLQCGEPFKVFPTTKNKRLVCSRECFELRCAANEPLRFWAKVDRSGNCWVWTGCINEWGYGAFMPYRAKQLVGAHRYSWQLHHGPIPEGLCVLHHCDNPPCVNPEHLFLGTFQDNVDDMMCKGRKIARRGEANGQSKLTEDDIRRIRRLYAFRGQGEGKVSGVQLAAEYGIESATVYGIVKRRAWKHVD
jgi:hypothetical protein